MIPIPQINWKPFKGRTIRITELEDCCTPPPLGTPCALAVFDSWTLATLAANVEEGETAFERKANGDICINERDPNLLLDLTVSLTLCQIQPEVISMLTGWPVTRDTDGNAIGFDIMSGVSTAEVAVEIWSGVSGIDCGQGARYGYNVLPCTSGWQLDGEIEWGGIDTINSITLTATAKDNHAWGSGPYGVQLDALGDPGPLLDPLQSPGALARIMSTDVPPPPVTDGCVPATAANGYAFPPDESPGSPAEPDPPTVTAIAPTSGPAAGGTDVTITGTAFNAPVVVEIGGAEATNVVIVSDTEITATTAAHAAGTVGVTVTTDYGTGPLPAAYTYN